VAAGKEASFIVLDASPLDNILNTRKISSSYLRVRWSIGKAQGKCRTPPPPLGEGEDNNRARRVFSSMRTRQRRSVSGSNRMNS